MFARHGRGAIEICLSEKGGASQKIGKHWFTVTHFTLHCYRFRVGLGIP